MPDQPCYGQAGANGQPVSDAHRIPTALRIVAWLFIVSGIWAAWDILTALGKGNLSINFGVLNFFIGFGLLRLSRVWRIWALIFTWFELICLPLFGLALVSGAGTVSGTLFEEQVNALSGRLAALMITVAFFLVSIWQYRTLTRPDVRLLFLCGLERKPSINMPLNVGLLAFVVLCFLAMANHGLKKHKGACVTAFGESTGSTPEHVMYYDRVGVELDRYLRAQGFSPTSIKPSNGESPHLHFETQKNIWYVREEGSNNLPCILVIQPTENSSGIHVEVQWDARDYFWRVNSLESRANALRAELTAWWEQYQKNNPVPGF
jgi:hypothetical protein